MSHRPSRPSMKTNKLAAKLDTLITVDKRILEAQQMTQTRAPPNEPDMPRIRLKPKKKVTQVFQYSAGNITGNSSTETTGALTFSLSVAAGNSSYLSSFQMYRILQVTVEFIAGSVGLTGTSNTNGQFYTAIDYTNSTTGIGSALSEYPNVQISPSIQYVERTFVPACLSVVYNGPATSAYAPEYRKWMSTEYAGAPHYGLKYSQTQTSSAVTPYNIQVTMIVQFKYGK